MGWDWEGEERERRGGGGRWLGRFPTYTKHRVHHHPIAELTGYRTGEYIVCHGESLFHAGQNTELCWERAWWYWRSAVGGSRLAVGS